MVHILLPLGLHQRWNLALSLEFATENSNALLLYNGRYNHLNDFIAIEIVDRQVVFSVSLGKKKGEVERLFTVKSFIAGGVSDGQWKSVDVRFSMEVGVGHLLPLCLFASVNFCVVAQRRFENKPFLQMYVCYFVD